MSGPAWAKGYPIADLKALAAPFAEHCRPFCHGAFGQPKEREIADALAADDLVWTREVGDAPAYAAVAIFRQLASASQHRDFAGRIIRLQAGDLFIRAIAGSPVGRERLIDHLIDRSGAPAVWAEDWVESPASAQWEALGFERAGTKIAASSDIKGLWVLGETEDRLPPALELADRPALVILDPAWASDEERGAVLAELGAYSAGIGAQPWAQHYSSYNKRQSWTAFALRGFDPADPGFIIKPAEMSKGWKAENPERLAVSCGDTEAMAAFPAAMAILDRIPAERQRIRFMRLAAGGGELTRHADIVDPEAGTGDGQTARLHIPILSPPDCEFSAWGLDGARLDRHLPEGSLAYLDTRKPHAVKNPGGADRVHLVIDVLCNAAIRAMIEGGG